MIRAAAMFQLLSAGRQLHSFILKMGFQQDINVSTRCLRNLSETGRVDGRDFKARHVDGKDHRICVDCHNAVRLMPMATEQKIVVKDASRFHLFEKGKYDDDDDNDDDDDDEDEDGDEVETKDLTKPSYELLESDDGSQSDRDKKKKKKKKRKRDIGISYGFDSRRRKSNWVDSDSDSAKKDYYFDSRGEPDTLAFGSLYNTC
ncbi:hypothetical protein ACFE04_026164 [Oxalis oulophora]